MIRELFEAKRNVKNLKEIEYLLSNCEQLLAVFQHPQPYIQINAPGGTKFERNAPFPAEVFIINKLAHRGVTPFDNYSDDE